MNVIKSFFDWIMGWVMTGVILLAVGFIIMTVSSKTGGSDSNTTSSHETKISKDEKLIEVRKEYWENGNLKSEVPYKKHYGLGWKKVKTKLKPHGIAKDYYASGTLKKEDPYIDGNREGTVKLYSEAGILEASAEFKNNKRNGKSIYYHIDGEVMDVEYYKDGNLTTSNV